MYPLAQYAFFWLLAFREAMVSIQALINKHDNITYVYADIIAALNETDRNIVIPEEPITGSVLEVPDNVKCYTQALPKAQTDKSIARLIVAGSAYIVFQFRGLFHICPYR